jgi:hypothetical protein
MEDLHPDWKMAATEDNWGYTVTWRVPWPPGSRHLVSIGEHRSPVYPVAVSRACLNAHRNYERYQLRRLEREQWRPSASGEPSTDEADAGG